MGSRLREHHSHAKRHRGADRLLRPGPGYLRQGEGGTVEYKVYPTTAHEWNVWEKQFGGVEGKLIESSRYYTLKATDRFGRCWEWWRTMPEISSSALKTGVHHVIDGKAHELAFSRRSGVPEDVFNLKMFFFAEAEIPCNARTEVITLAGGEKRQTSSLLNVAEFSTPIGDFHVSNQAGLVLVELDSEAALSKHIEIRIVEALGLVLARPLFWNVVERYENGTETVRVRGQRVIANAKLLPPVGRGPIDLTGEVWRLFEKYLTFICGYSEDRFHPCSRHLFSALEASAGTINAQALALGVAVEGIVKKLFPKAGSLPAGLKPKVKQLRKHFEKWEGLKDKQTKNALWKRVQDMLGRLLDVSTKSKLYALAAEKAVYEPHVEAWGAIRNTSAHGETPGSENLQTLVDLCHQVMVLMYHLSIDSSNRFCPPSAETVCVCAGRNAINQVEVPPYLTSIRSIARGGTDQATIPARNQLDESLPISSSAPPGLRASTSTTRRTAGSESVTAAGRRPRKRLPWPRISCGRGATRSTGTTVSTGSGPRNSLSRASRKLEEVLRCSSERGSIPARSATIFTHAARPSTST